MVKPMKLMTFYNSYDLYELEIKSIKTDDNIVSILLDMTSHLDLMGNGIRPSLDVSYRHMFKFKYEGDKINLKKNINVTTYLLDGDKIKLGINKKTIYLISDPEVILNYV